MFKVAYLFLLVSTLTRACSDEANWTGNARSAVLRHLVSYDASYYLLLSKMGYKHSDERCAFYPLYPLLIRWVSAITGSNDVLVGMVLANLFSFAAFLLFFQMAMRRYGEAVAVSAIILLLAFAGSLFFQFMYTESLFFLLVMFFCLALELEDSALAMVAGFLLPLTRAVGIFCVFPLLWHLFFGAPPNWWRRLSGCQGLPGKIAHMLEPRPDDSPAFSGLSRQRARCLFLAPLLGWSVYFLLMWKWTGNAFEGFAAQKQFGGVESIQHLFQPLRFVTQFLNPTNWHAFTGSLLDRCVFILLIYCFPLIWKLNKSWCIWAFFLGVVPAVSGGFTSFTRFASVVFPMFIAMAVFLDKPEMRWLRWLTLIVFAALHMILVWRFVNFKWAG
jgi:hypothetical protein